MTSTTTTSRLIRRLLFVAAASAALTLPLAGGSAEAAVYGVTTTSDVAGTCTPEPSPCSLRQAVAAASAASDTDTINVPAGDYPLSLGQLAFGTTTVTVNGAGVGSTSIRQVGVARVINATNTTLTLDGVTISDGSATTGGGINATNSNITVQDSEISGNTATALVNDGGVGAGIYASGGSVSISGTTLTNNFAEGGPLTPGGGAGLFVLLSTLSITDSRLINSTAEGATTGTGAFGGGLLAYNSTVSLTRATVQGNDALQGDTTGGFGGGAFVASSTTTVTDSTISANTAVGTDNPGKGGGLVVSEGTPTISNSTVSGNQATGSGQGGGIFVDALTPVILRNSTINGNSAIGVGGSGGNLAVDGNAVTFGNTILADGSADSGSNCDLGAVTPTLEGRNLESADTCALGAGDMKNVAPLLGPLQDNGGSTMTHALLPLSPALDTALGCPPPSADQRGVSRPQGAACDIGSFEREFTPPGPDPPGPTPDRVAPVLSALKLAPARFAALKRGQSVMSKNKKRKPRRGSRVTYRLSEDATTSFTVERTIRGRKSGKKCLARKKRGRRCIAYRPLKGSFNHAGKSGSNSLRFSGRVGGRKLRPGSYRLVATPTDAAGNRGKAVRKSFRIVRR